MKILFISNLSVLYNFLRQNFNLNDKQARKLSNYLTKNLLFNMLFHIFFIFDNFQ